MRASLLAGVVVALVVAVPASAGPRAQAQGQPPAPAPAQPQVADQPITAGQVQLWFEAYTLLQAQDALQLNEAQYWKFASKLKVLQETRRRHLQAHQRILNDLRRLTNPQTGSNDEMAILDRLKAMKDEDASAATELQKAYDAVDETLDARQQARFRIFEDRVEQQKLELLMRARQNARAAARGKKES